MNKSILRILVTITILTCFLFGGDLFAETDIKVAIIPFSIDAKQPNHQIKTKIPLMISEKIEQDGAKVILSEIQHDTEDWNFSQFRQFGIESGVDYILTGSVFVAGESISIDVKLINIYEKENITSFYSDADNFENLFSAVSKVSKEIAGEIFHNKIITDIAVIGNKRIEKDAILKIISSKAGDIIKPDAVSNDLRKIYEMGYFDNVIVNKETHDKGVKVIFEVAEKPSVRKIKFNKNSIFEDQELADIVGTRTGSILNIHKLNSDVNRLRSVYTEKNYYNCSITYEVVSLEHSQADIIFNIEEGDKIKVEKITFEGNKYFSDKKIKKAMETSEKGLFSFITTSGNLNETEVKNDVMRIESLYKNNGFIDTKVSDPIIHIGEKLISIHFKISEGDQYKVKKIDISGDLILSKEELLEKLEFKEAELYNRENIRKDVLSLSDIYSNKGFANVDVTPLVNKNDQDKTMDITYSIAKGEPVYFNRVIISGNLKTRDKVIRREIKIIEQGLFSKNNIQKSYVNLNRLDYFKEIEVQPVKTLDENKMDLNVNVIEKQTGNFTFGGGFSSSDGGFGSISVEERNLFGKGQTGKISTRISSESVLYNIRFYEPYVFDTPVSAGFDLYKEDKEYDYYDKDSLGLKLTLAYKLRDYTTIGAQYNIEDFSITNVKTASTNMTPGSFLTSSIKPFIQYDSRNDLFLPTQGAKHNFSIEYAGEFLGGDIDYTKYFAETSVFFPLFWKFTGGLHAEAGYLDDRSSDAIDIDYIRFYLGGIHSIRGFDKYDISGRRDGDSRQRGGEKFVQFNAEMTFPITEKYKVVGVLFYDRGDVYRTSENIDLGDQFSSIGAGFRWASPVGPLRVEYGWVIDGKNVKKTGDGQFEFSVGASF
ncbi:MAG: outer membrane protein assembly factor BamA [Proteobacteria bacterium]|nr:outer membrane protein assembly factor BamA [Pseudomonadota bacterium]MBU1584370.1 outer membrane protein assembly factor BamA [Pseudomonadota bacterium]MBU2628094.1 outer membrane protein assembly factor BamA [Pseudomonadota bacterium]